MIQDILILSPNRVWRTYPGGKILDMIQGVPHPEDGNFPEDWIGSTTRAINRGREHLKEEGLSSIDTGGKRQTLHELIQQEPEALVGSDHFERFGATTQFLVKFLDSAIRLHLQCHPTISFARKHLNSNSGKTEAYVILRIRDEVREPYIYLGFQNPPDRKIFKKAIETQDISEILSCFKKIPIKPGDVFIVPGGLPHAIGEGVFMVEIMEPTDFAVRIEFDRGGYVLPQEARFMGRDTDFALSMFNFEKLPVEEVRARFFLSPRLLARHGDGAEYNLIDREQTGCFRVKRLDVRGRLSKAEHSFYTGIVIDGSGVAVCSDREYPLARWDKFFVPFATEEITFRSDAGMSILTVFPPE